MPERHAMSEVGHGADDWRRYSSGTAATFGRWDLGLQTSIMPMHNRTNSDVLFIPRVRQSGIADFS